MDMSSARFNEKTISETYVVVGYASAKDFCMTRIAKLKPAQQAGTFRCYENAILPCDFLKNYVWGQTLDCKAHCINHRAPFQFCRRTIMLQNALYGLPKHHVIPWSDCKTRLDTPSRNQFFKPKNLPGLCALDYEVCPFNHGFYGMWATSSRWSGAKQIRTHQDPGDQRETGLSEFF